MRHKLFLRRREEIGRKKRRKESTKDKDRDEGSRMHFGDEASSTAGAVDDKQSSQITDAEPSIRSNIMIAISKLEECYMQGR